MLSLSSTPPDLIIFDWDDTLVDSYDAIHVAINAARAAFGMPPWSLEEARLNCRRALKESFPEWFGAEWERARDVYYDTIRGNHLRLLKRKPGAEKLLAALHRRHIPMAVASNKNSIFLEKESAHLDWDKYFMLIVSAADMPRGKPAPDVVDFIRAKLTIPAGSSVWYVGDNEIDLQTALGSGCTPIIVGNAIADTTPGNWIPTGNCLELLKIIEVALEETVARA